MNETGNMQSLTVNGLHGVPSQNTELLIRTAVRTSEPTYKWNVFNNFMRRFECDSHCGLVLRVPVYKSIDPGFDSCRVPGYRSRGPGFDSGRYNIF
jgi:hypothetical protein